jgi:hypothetical protein
VVTRLLTPKPWNAAQDVYAGAFWEAATQTGSVGPEHYLLAAVANGRLGTRLLEDYGVTTADIRERIEARAQEALAALGISLDSVRGEVIERFGRDAWERPGTLPVLPEAQRALELTVRDAAGLTRRRITADDVLLGLLRHSPTARRVLDELDVPVAELQERLRLELRIRR